ncbi:MAG: enoyl-CoA hydratase/isomerase family protein, partial [Deltaproteobacteria bacterium]|nr:enoyl-CoA hydratase/isomerase family protein [Deltaproteobacteria bacterium]
IAAINGHAFGDGTIMACACDFRFMKADRGFFCFPEIDINIPFLPGMLAIVRKAIPYYKLEELAFSGKRTGAAELEAHHVIIKACDNEEVLMREALAFAKTFNKKRPIFGEMKKRMHGSIIEIMEKEDPVYIEPLQLMM